MEDPVDYFGPEPPEHWWLARPGRHLRDAFAAFDHGIGYFGLHDEQQPEYTDLEPQVWAALRHSYLRACEVAEAARSLLAPSTQQSPHSLPMEHLVDPMLEADIASVLEAVPEYPGPCLALDHPDAPDHLFATTLLLSMMRIVPGITEQEDPWGTPYTDVGFDEALYARIRVLLRHLVPRPDVRSSQYLRLVARCYLLDLRTEFAIMARAALEAALEASIPEADVRAKVGPARGKVPIGQYISYCLAKEVFIRATADAATRVKDAGNDAVHLTPGIELAPDILLDDLAGALAALNQRRPDAHPPHEPPN